MTKHFIILFFTPIGFIQVIAQHSDSSTNHHAFDTRPLKLSLKIDIPVTTAATAWTLYAFAQTSKHNGSSIEEVTGLKTSNIDWFDRWAVTPYNKTADNLSYLPFYGAVAYPFIFFTADKKMRKDVLELSFLYLEAMTITGALYGSATAYASRYRPFVYSNKTPMELRLSPNSEKAFFAGHVALVATSTFFVASVFASYHPDSKFKWLMYSIAAAATVTTGYLRHQAGEHFPSDLLVGAAIGTITGLLVPTLHRTKFAKKQKLVLLPYAGEQTGLTLIYKL
jgi:membrane-associated phospholipid phosphatase